MFGCTEGPGVHPSRSGVSQLLRQCAQQAPCTNMDPNPFMVSHFMLCHVLIFWLASVRFYNNVWSVSDGCICHRIHQMEINRLIDWWENEKMIRQLNYLLQQIWSFRNFNCVLFFIGTRHKNFHTIVLYQNNGMQRRLFAVVPVN